MQDLLFPIAQHPSPQAHDLAIAQWTGAGALPMQ